MVFDDAFVLGATILINEKGTIKGKRTKITKSFREILKVHKNYYSLQVSTRYIVFTGIVNKSHEGYSIVLSVLLCKYL